MASLDAVRQKIYRAKEHWDELWDSLTTYYQSDPGDLFPSEGSTPDNPLFIFKEKKPVPAKIALVFGDALQCLRSSLDYLVWELVDAGGIKAPHRRLMFPLALTQHQYQNDLKNRDRLDGVPPEAIAIIDRFQPYLQPNPKETVLGILDELTNVNKHRRVIFTGLHGVLGELPPSAPYIMGVVRNVDAQGNVLREVHMRGVLTLQEGLTKSIEITNCVDTAAQFIGEEMLPLFEKFFK
jgi:hypothetical protein